jgi:hypothetical protein
MLPNYYYYHHHHLLYAGYIPETNYVPREYSVAAILLLLFVVLISLVYYYYYYYYYQSLRANVVNLMMASE